MQVFGLEKLNEILISASKFSVLNDEEVEEGEQLEEEETVLMEEENKEDEVRSESDIVEESILDQQEKEKERAAIQKGLR